MCVLSAADTLAVAQVETYLFGGLSQLRPQFSAIWARWRTHKFGAASDARLAPGGCGVGSECVLGADDALWFCPEL